MLAFLWTIFGLNAFGAISHFVGLNKPLEKNLDVRPVVVSILLNLGIAGWALYFIISGAR